MKWRNALGIAALVGIAAVPITSSSVTAATSGGNALQRGTTLYMAGGKLTEAQAVAVAKNYNIIAEQSNAVSAYVSQMHAVNPNLKIVAYVNGSYDTSVKGTQYPATWYAKDTAGAKVFSTQFKNWLMLPKSPSGWNGQVATLCTQAIKQSHYDGCFLDSLGIAPFDKGYVNGSPVDPSTRKVFTTTAWITAAQGTITATEKANPGKLVIANGLGNGQKWPATQPLLTAAGTAMSELWLRVNNWKVNQFESPAQWLGDVNMLVTAASKHESILTVTKLWVSATTAQQNQWHAYTEASFLLGSDGHSFYCFTTSKTQPGLSVDTPYDHVAIGTPTAAMKASGNAFMRTFTNGVVAVNPTSSAVTISLGGTFTDLAGKSVSSETLPADSGDIFVK
jgi:hypothetical protein